ncbi:MAG TPA: PQQ-binding-like beta-propeller repeat protein, partial [Candidatus Dormibacteraeota bacterium]|nr:PQQ-binding-like beta-propeller repeat protein [Candidatus Dormibacteraeota bacterium]
DAFNSRVQSAEDSLGPSTLTGIAPVWTFSLSSRGDTGSLNSTPVTSGGCVFVASSNGTAYAIDAGSGTVRWQTSLPAVSTGLGGEIVGAPAVSGGKLIVLVNQQGDGAVGPYVAALDVHSGRTLWTSTPLSTLSGYYTNASAQVFNGVVFAGFSPPEGDSTGQGGFVLLDVQSGRTLKITTTITPADQAQGFAGGGIWSTPAFNGATGFAYVGAGNPYSKTVEDVHTNAILKVDLRRNSKTFGDIVASYKGNVDQYTETLQALSQTPLCVASEDVPDPLDDPVCGQLDLDFGAAPNLFSTGGRLLVGDLQKSGVYHVADAGSMAPVWSTIVGASCAVCNAASTAATGGAVYGESTPVGFEFSLDGGTGAQRWATPVGDVVHYQSTSIANGIAYTFDTAGFFDAYDTETGVPLLRRPMTEDAGAPTAAFTSGGVAIAYHTLFVAASEGGSSAPSQASNGFLIAYRNAALLP